MREAPQPRGVGELLDYATDLLRQHFVRLILIAFLPLLVLQFLGWYLADGTEETEALTMLGMTLPSMTLITAILTAVATRICVADLLGEDRVHGRLWVAVIWTCVFAMLHTVMIVLGGVVSFGILSIFLWFKFLLTPNVLAVEQGGLKRAMGRSFRLTNRSFFRAAGVGIGGLLIMAPISGISSEWPVEVLRQFFLEEVPMMPGWGALFLALAVSSLLLAVSWAFPGAAFAAFYVDQLVRHEGIDLEIRLADRRREVSDTPPPPPVQELI